ncbi:hypothetical protein ACUN7V_15485 [Quadrisphaera oryzae]|uniref:hypothetical protein n=1 Tax=Quadrisphaera TaxID=317661 RepID=UPI001648AE19|nr:hypothetical protein [Quadrisphaera sp. RL12-1S]MBC3760613.1 hypothetical protein [Quadrisphaera sp. RL12-1S]
MRETDVWSALPGGPYRFDADYYVEDTLRHYGYTLDDLPVMAAEARQHYPELFDPGWIPQVERSGWEAAAASLANRTP